MKQITPVASGEVSDRGEIAVAPESARKACRAVRAFLEMRLYAVDPFAAHRLPHRQTVGFDHGPAIGAHNEEVLRDLLGMAPAEIEALRQEGVI